MIKVWTLTSHHWFFLMRRQGYYKQLFKNSAFVGTILYPGYKLTSQYLSKNVRGLLSQISFAISNKFFNNV